MKRIAAGLSLLAASVPFAVPSAFAQADRPNFLLIITDDQRYDMLTRDFMPHTLALIADQGIVFDHAYVTTPLCGPSRASILTGMYATTHGVRRNGRELHKPTFVERLKEAGYTTGLVGKYLNSWDGSARPEFDFWVAFEGGASTYYNPRLNVNGEWRDHQGYITYILQDYATEFLVRAPPERPFVLLFAPNAPHYPSTPAPQDESLFSDLPPHRPSSFDEADVSDKPEWLQAIPRFRPFQIASIDQERSSQLRTLRPVDEAVASLLLQLQHSGRLERTVVFFLSDNGVYWGENRIQEGKDRIYEPAIRVPFAVRYPPFGRGRIESRLVANIDIAPTLYELAGVPVPGEVEGRSLVPLLGPGGTSVAWRDVLFLEGRPDPPFDGVHTGRYVYVETDGDRSELYDLSADPYELTNVADDRQYTEVRKALRARLQQGKD